MRYTPHFLRSIGTILVAATTASAGAYGPFPAYQGPKIPASAAGLAFITKDQLLNGPYVIGYFLDVDGDGHADVTDVARISPSSIDAVDFRGAYVSPSDSCAVYVFTTNVQTTVPSSLTTLRRDGETWRRVEDVGFQTELSVGIRTAGNIPGTRESQGNWAGPIAFRHVDGGDRVLAVSSKADGHSYSSKYAVLLDGPDDDPYGDHWTAAIGFPGLEAETMDDRGNVIARHIQDVAHPHNTDYFVTIHDTNGDGLPDTVDDSSRVSIAGTGLGAYGPGDVDLGSDRLYSSALITGAFLNSRRNIAPGSVRTQIVSDSDIIWQDWQLFAARDGSPFIFARNQVSGNPAVGVGRDLNFDDLYNDSVLLPLEIPTLVDAEELPDPYIQNGSVAELTELPVSSARTSAAFRDFGEYPGGEAFRFRFGGQDFDRFTVGSNGTVSFGSGTTPAAVTGAPSLPALEALHGAIAPAWSDQWDTSQLHVFAGYAPVQPSFATGDRVLAFSIEWRNLRAPGWSADRAFSMRLLLFSDGTFRVDYGAMEGTELGGTHFVSGYSGPGSFPSDPDLDLSDHSFGGTPAGSGRERVLAEEFGPSNPSDLGHLWTRWLGYPERQDTGGPAPKVLNPQLKKGKKLVLGKAGSDIVAGATVTVDGAETFALVMNTKGTKWVVGPKATSTPGGLTIKQVFAGGGTHTLVVTNPDGGTSSAASVP